MRENLLSSLSEETKFDIGSEKQQQAPAGEEAEAIRRDLLAEDYRKSHPNIYEAVIVMSQRARQIGQKQARIIEQFMSTKNRTEDDDEDDDEIIIRSIEDDDEDGPQLPRFEKPTILAMNEMYNGLLKLNTKEE